MEEEILTLSSLERRSWADFTSPSYARIGGKPPPWSEEQISQGGRSLRGGLDQTSRGREKAGADSLGGVPSTGRVECPQAPAHSGGVSRGGAGRRWAQPLGRRRGGLVGGGEEKSAKLAGTCTPLPPPPKGIRTRSNTGAGDPAPERQPRTIPPPGP